MPDCPLDPRQKRPATCPDRNLSHAVPLTGMKDRRRVLLTAASRERHCSTREAPACLPEARGHREGGGGGGRLGHSALGSRQGWASSCQRQWDVSGILCLLLNCCHSGGSLAPGMVRRPLGASALIRCACVCVCTYVCM